MDRINKIFRNVKRRETKLSTLFIVILILSAFILVGQAIAQDVFFTQEDDGVSFIYKNITKEIPVYGYTITHDEVCGSHETCHNVTVDKKQIAECDWVFECYDVPTRKKIIIDYKTKLLDQVKLGERKYDVTYYGNVHIYRTNLSLWSVPIGDRNFKESPQCRTYEIEKGVCTIEII